MTVWSGILILLGVPAASLLAGAWIGPRLGLARAGERVGASLLGGGAILLLALSLVNLFLPLRGWALALVALPVAAALVRRDDLRSLASDFRATLFSFGGGVVLSGALVFLALLLWPRLTEEDLVVYDGSSNHDTFFWITGADHLRQHTYLESATVEATHPGRDYSGAMTGWTPPWGRMGAEGYVAVVASATGLTPLAAYLWASAALYWAWLAAVYLVARTFLVPRLRWPALLALGLGQPLFAFYHHNANLPNLLGMLAGAIAVLATEHLCRALASDTPSRVSWAALAALAWHALLCSYPEMAPFIAVPCGLLVVRSANRHSARRAFLWNGAAAGAALLLNPATTIRAAHGFFTSLSMARDGEHWASFIAASGPGEVLPTLLMLSAKFGRELGDTGGTVLSVALVGIIFSTWWRARDRVGVACLLSGAGLLAFYTAATGFGYGWQKTMQFSAIFFAAMLPVAAMEQPVARAPKRLRGYLFAMLLLAVFVYALVVVQLDFLKWSGRKLLHTDWQALDRPIAGATEQRPVVIEAATFRYSFFHGMWAPYFLRQAPVVYAPRGEQNGGYLRSLVLTENTSAPAAAVLVGREWADAFEPDAPRLAHGREFALLERATRVTALEGVAPTAGLPRLAGPEVALTLVPRTDGTLEVEIGACEDVEVRGYWRAWVERPGATPVELTLAGTTGPWRGSLPLAEGVAQTVRLRFVPAFGTRTPKAAAFPLDRLQILPARR